MARRFTAAATRSNPYTPCGSGAFKSVSVSHNGDEKVTGLHLPGEVMGPDAINGKRHGYDAIAPWAKSSSPYYLQTLDAIARHYKVGLNAPFEELSKKVKDVILFGSGEEEIKFSYDDGARRYDIKKAFEGVIANMERRYQESDSAWIREELERSPL